MSTIAPPRATGLKALHEARDTAAAEIAAAIQRVIPAGFRARIAVTVDNGVVQAEDVAIELRPRQRRS